MDTLDMPQLLALAAATWWCAGTACAQGVLAPKAPPQEQDNPLAVQFFPLGSLFRFRNFLREISHRLSKMLLDNTASGSKASQARTLAAPWVMAARTPSTMPKQW